MLNLRRFYTFEPRRLEKLRKNIFPFPQCRKPSDLITPFAQLFSRSASRSPLIFDRSLKRLQRERASKSAGFSAYEYLRQEIADRLSERLLDFRRSFRRALDVGAGASNIRRALVRNKLGFGLELLFEIELSPAMLEYGSRRLPLAETPFRTLQVVADEENFLPQLELSGALSGGLFDLAISCMSLHWVNDLPGTLAQIRAALEPGGVFLGAMLGGETLHELRVSLQLAEETILGGVGAHVSPMIEFRDAAGLLSQSGFTLITIDVDTILVPYPDMVTLMRHLQGMAENNALYRRRPWLSRQVLEHAAEIYRDRFQLSKPQMKSTLASSNEPLPENREDWIGATFQVVYMVGWTP